MSTRINELTMQDYDEVVVLWSSIEGIGLNDADSRGNMVTYLDRNPGLSFVARDNGQVVGAVLCGHDGRRGYLHHLAVNPSHRKRGIGKALVTRCLDALRGAGIVKCNIFVFDDNETGLSFWKASGWAHRPELQFMQRKTETE